MWQPVSANSRVGTIGLWAFCDPTLEVRNDRVAWHGCRRRCLLQRLAPLQAKKQAEAQEDVDLEMVALEAEEDAVSSQQCWRSCLILC